MANLQLDKLADELIASRYFDVPALVRLLHQRVDQERRVRDQEDRLYAIISQLRLPPLAKPNL